ncbi:MAG: Gamma-glutamyltransferase, partial [Bacteroidetes bacterium]|nr:Gamma-glutamyltransferase [Bacteroidota bacterium]
TIRMERFGTTMDTQRLLELMGHSVDITKSSRAMGSAMAILIDPLTGLRLGSSDPRQDDGAVRGY